MRMERGLRSVVICAMTLLCCGAAAFGTAMPVTANVVSVQATSNGHTDTFEAVFPVAQFDGNLSWSLPTPLSLADGAYNIGTVKNLQVTFNADPQVDLQFAIVNNSMLYPVMFNIVTATIIFDGNPNAEAAATASVTLTQGAGSPSGAYISGLFPNGKVYQARYSTDSIMNTQNVFASLVPSMSFSAGLGRSATETLPAVGMSALNTTVYMIESEFKFILSPGDQASGTSAFLITPEPSCILMILSGFALIKRRSR